MPITDATSTSAQTITTTVTVTDSPNSTRAGYLPAPRSRVQARPWATTRTVRRDLPVGLGNELPMQIHRVVEQS